MREFYFKYKNSLLNSVFHTVARHEEKGLAACEHLKKEGLHAPKFYQLDITDRQQIMDFRQHLQKTYGGIDILINYASVPHKVFAFLSSDVFCVLATDNSSV